MTADEVLEKSKGIFETVVIVGVRKDGEIDINTNNPQFPIIHYILNRSLFKLNIFEDNKIKNDKKVVEEVKEGEVKTPKKKKKQNEE